MRGHSASDTGAVGAASSSNKNANSRFNYAKQSIHDKN